METATPAKGHIATACKAIQKQIDKYVLDIAKKLGKVNVLNSSIEDRKREIDELKEQIKKLKG